MTDRKRRKERYEILFEDVNSKMDLVLEGYKEFGNKLVEAKNERVDIRDDLTKKIEFVATSLNKKIEDTRSDLSERIEDTEKKLNQKIEDTRSDLSEKIEDTEKKLNQKIEDTRSDLSERIENAEKRLGKRIDRIGSRQDAHEGRIEVIEKKRSI